MKKLVALALAALTAIGLCACGNAGGNYPSKDVDIVIPYKVGGTTDLAVRGVLDAIPDSVFDKDVTVENIVGGSGLVGTAEFLTRSNDGYTLGLVNCDLVLNYVNGTTEINPTKDMIALGAVEQDPYILFAGKNAPYADFASFIQYCQDNPGQVVVGVTSVGSVPNLLGSVLLNAGLDVKVIAYDSAPDAIAAVLAGEAGICISAMAPAVGNLDSGDLVALAVTTSARSAALPEIPTMAEINSDMFGDVNLLSWIMIAVPAGTDDAIVSYWKSALADAVKSDAYAQTRAQFYFEEITITADQMASFIDSQAAYYATLVK